MAKRMMVGSIDNKIWYGAVKDHGTFYTMPNKREDVTDMAIAAVFEWMLQNMNNDDSDAYQIRYPNMKGYVLEMRKE